MSIIIVGYLGFAHGLVLWKEYSISSTECFSWGQNSIHIRKGSVAFRIPVDGQRAEIQ
jgi:hypothetical protein